MDEQSLDQDVAAELEQAETHVEELYERVPRRLKLGFAVVLIASITIVLAVWHQFYFHWFAVHTGITNPSGVYYGFWSGIGSDFGEATLIGGGIAVWRHHNCHVKGCVRVGHPVTGTPYKACPRHHPAHHGSKRAVSLEAIHRAHHESKKAH